MRFKSDIGVDIHLRAAIRLTRWGAYAFLAMAGLVTALTNITGLVFGAGITDEAAAQVGGVFFYLFLGVIGMFLIVGFVGSAALHYFFGENRQEAVHP